MKTSEEQLTDLRLSFVKKLYKGQPEEVVRKAVKDIHRMTFKSNEEFEDFLKDEFKNDLNRIATDEEVDLVLETLGLENTSPDKRSEEDKMLDDIMDRL